MITFALHMPPACIGMHECRQSQMQACAWRQPHVSNSILPDPTLPYHHIHMPENISVALAGATTYPIHFEPSNPACCAREFKGYGRRDSIRRPFDTARARIIPAATIEHASLIEGATEKSTVCAHHVCKRCTLHAKGCRSCGSE